VQTTALDLIDRALVQAYKTPDARLIISMAPQEGKSVRVAADFPTWWLTQRPDSRVVAASYGSSLALRNGRSIRRRIKDHKLGITIADDNGAVGDWTLSGYEGGVLSVGVGSGLTGRPADLMVIDDPIKNRKEADSETYRENVWDWWTDTVVSRLAPGAPTVIILTRWHHDDLAGRLMGEDDGYEDYDPERGLAPNRWTYLNIPAEADHRPEKGEEDPLGREPGEFMDSARKRTTAQWQARKKAAGPRTWASLYQGRPTPGSGDLWPEEWPRYTSALHITNEDGRCFVPGWEHEIVQSWDFTFKDNKTSDYVVGQVWMRQGPNAYLLDMVRGRWNFNRSCEAMLALSAKWPQAVGKLVEDKANGPAIINSLQKQISGVIPVEPVGSKFARAAAVSPFAHARNIWLPTAELLPNVEELVVELEAFPAGAHDDTVDALSQATDRLLLHPLLDQDQAIRDQDDWVGEDDPHAILGGY
jgi:predicted phage terminase large subunit-like protein